MADVQEAAPQDAGHRLASSLEQLLATFAGRATVTLREVSGVEALASLSGPVSALSFRLVRGASGPAALLLPGSGGLALARMLLGEDGSSVPETPGPEEEDALRELANQVAGTTASALGSLLGGSVGFEATAAAWLPAGGREFQAPPDAAVLGLTVAAGAVTSSACLVLPRAALPPPPAAPMEASLPLLPESGPRRNGNGIEMLLDISLPVTVELGRARMLIRDILHLAPGSILELDKLAGEPVDIVINDKSIARGEVVVIDENFGVRLTSIVTPSERVMNLR